MCALTTRDRILEFIRECPYSPSVREIGVEVERTEATVHAHLVELERQGLIGRGGSERRVYAKDAA
jgi:DNA-binding IclR family transcriptional regulator